MALGRFGEMDVDPINVAEGLLVRIDGALTCDNTDGAPPLIVTGDAAESLEVMYPYQRLREEGYDVDIAAPSRKTLRFVVHDFEPGYDTYTEKPGHRWNADVALADVDPADYVAIVVPGGRAPEYLRNNADAQRIVQVIGDDLE